MVDWYDCKIHCSKAGRKLVSMRTTYPEAIFDFVDLTAAEDSTITSVDSNPISSLALLCQKGISAPEYATLELNCFVLDGTREIMPQSPEDIPFFSSDKSDDNCDFSQSITVTFSEEHSSIGFSLTFTEQYPTEIRITCYNKGSSLLLAKTFNPDSQSYYCSMNVQNYSKVVIEFLETRMPGQYAKLNNILFGQEWLLSRDRIKTASIYEEIDPTSATLSINTAKIEIIDREGNFDVKNQDGLWKALQRKQGIRLIEHIDSSVTECGTFYLNDWESGDNIISMSFVDAFGLMDKTTFCEGKIYQNVAAGLIIEEIMTSFGTDNYEVDKEIAEVRLSGYLAIQSHRAALQQVVFACGAVADCSRSDKIRIFKPGRYVSRTIGTNRKFMGTTIKLEDYISDVAISYKTYALDSKSSEVFKSTLNQGDNRIEFSTPCLPESLVTSAGSIKEAKTNYIVLNMKEAGECVITGTNYISVENTAKASVGQIAVGEVAKVKTYSGCTLMDAVQAKMVAEYILDYYQLRQVVTMKFINAGERVGEWCEVFDAGNKASITGVTSQTIDLTGGNISSASCRGYSIVVSANYYTGTELYSGGGVLL